MKKYKLFVIEDNRTEGLLLQLALSGIEDLEVRNFDLGNKLLEALPEKPDIVIADLNLPDINGLDLIRKIRAFDENIRIVVVSAQRDMDVLAEAQAEGVYNYLMKSEACLTYLNRVIKELLIVLKYHAFEENQT